MNKTFDKPTPVTDVLLAFPAGVRHLMPEYSAIPEEFKRSGNPWAEWQSSWFYEGLKTIPEAKAGIDRREAMRHLSAIQGSFEPKHEHKQAAVAYLASLWLVSPAKAEA